MHTTETVMLLGASGMVGKNLTQAAPAHINLLTPTSKELNLLNFEQTKSYIEKHKPTLIIHSSGIVGGIHANIANPVKFLLENTDMGRNIVWAAYECGVKKLLNFGSSCMYPRNGQNPLKENAILTGELEPTNEDMPLLKYIHSGCALI
jgi:GDP-L-fucose synthase